MVALAVIVGFVLSIWIGPKVALARLPTLSVAAPLVERFTAELTALGLPTAQGRFGAEMRVALVNDGPVTLWLDSDDLPRRQ